MELFENSFDEWNNLFGWISNKFHLKANSYILFFSI